MLFQRCPENLAVHLFLTVLFRAPFLPLILLLSSTVDLSYHYNYYPFQDKLPTVRVQHRRRRWPIINSPSPLQPARCSDTWDTRTINVVQRCLATLSKFPHDYLFGLLWHINLRWLFNSKVILLEEEQWCYLTQSREDKGIHTFPNGIYCKVNVIAQLEFELATTIPPSSALTITPRGHQNSVSYEHRSNWL